MCQEQAWLRASLDGELSAEEEQMLRQHLADCGSCQREEQALRGRMQLVSEAFGALDPLAMPTDPAFALARWRARQAGPEPVSFGFSMFQSRGQRERRREGALGSLLVHLGMAGLVLAASTSPILDRVTMKTVNVIMPLVAPPPQVIHAGGGGGGGDRSRTLPEKGRLPRVSPRQYTPPEQVVRNLDPKLPMEPTIDVPNDLHIASNLQQYGNPMDGRGLPSNGPGAGGGIGTGDGGGIGSGKGPGFGVGDGGGVSGGAYQVGGGVSNPVPIFRPEPDYPDQARKARFQGTVTLSVIVDASGNVSSVHVSRPMGMGLDEKAIEAVKKWKFRPGMKNGKPVPVYANIELTFRLL